MEQVVSFIGLTVSIAGAYLVGKDASRLKAQGASVSPALWVVLTFLGSIFAIAGYLWLRQRVWAEQGVVGLSESPGEFGGPPRQPSHDECNEKRLRELVRELEGEGREPAEILRRLQDHYHAKACADVLDVGRFEEIVVSALASRQP